MGKPLQWICFLDKVIKLISREANFLYSLDGSNLRRVGQFMALWHLSIATYKPSSLEMLTYPHQEAFQSCKSLRTFPDSLRWSVSNQFSLMYSIILVNDALTFCGFEGWSLFLSSTCWGLPTSLSSFRPLPGITFLFIGFNEVSTLPNRPPQHKFPILSNYYLQ